MSLRALGGAREPDSITDELSHVLLLQLLSSPKASPSGMMPSFETSVRERNPTLKCHTLQNYASSVGSNQVPFSRHPISVQ